MGGLLREMEKKVADYHMLHVILSPLSFFLSLNLSGTAQEWNAWAVVGWVQKTRIQEPTPLLQQMTRNNVDFLHGFQLKGTIQIIEKVSS